MYADFFVFQSSFLSTLRTDGLESVLDYERDVHVGAKGCDQTELRQTHGRERVDKSLKVWNMLMRLLQDKSVWRLMFACGSPQGAWRTLTSHYTESIDEVRERLEKSVARFEAGCIRKPEGLPSEGRSFEIEPCGCRCELQLWTV